MQLIFITTGLKIYFYTTKKYALHTDQCNYAIIDLVTREYFLVTVERLAAAAVAAARGYSRASLRGGEEYN